MIDFRKRPTDEIVDYNKFEDDLPRDEGTDNTDRSRVSEDSAEEGNAANRGTMIIDAIYAPKNITFP